MYGLDFKKEQLNEEQLVEFYDSAKKRYETVCKKIKEYEGNLEGAYADLHADVVLDDYNIDITAEAKEDARRDIEMYDEWLSDLYIEAELLTELYKGTLELTSPSRRYEVCGIWMDIKEWKEEAVSEVNRKYKRNFKVEDVDVSWKRTYERSGDLYADCVVTLKDQAK